MVKIFSPADLCELLDSQFSGSLVAKINESDDLFQRRIGCLFLFLQNNFTGPYEKSDGVCDLKTEEEARRELKCDGEDVLTHIKDAALLVEALRIEECEEFLYKKWWMALILFTQQRVIENPCETLKNKILERFCECDEISDKKILAQFYLQRALAEADIKLAQEMADFKWSFTGVLGKRTRFQTFNVSQLVLQTEKTNVEEEEKVVDVAEVDGPRNLDLNDDTLLEKMKPENGEIVDERKLNPLEQSILITNCLFLKSKRAKDDILVEEMLAFVRRILETSTHWIVYSMALLQRSRLENNKTRTVERSVLQINALVDQYRDDETPSHKRLYSIFNVLYPNKVSLEEELADSFLNLGLIKSALEIYERLELFEGMITCYKLLDQSSKAEELLNRRIEDNPNDYKALFYLGELKNDKEILIKSWEISEKKYSKAKRLLGQQAFKQGKFQECISHLQEALKVNSLFEETWFLLGCAAMRVDEMEIAKEAFVKVVSLSPDNGEGWSNLAAVQQRQGFYKDCVVSLRQALKTSFDNWKIWENLLYMSINTGELNDALLALKRIFELKENFIDVQYLDVFISEALLIKEQNPLLIRQTSQFLALIHSKITSNKEIWEISAKFYKEIGEIEKFIESKRKAYRCIQSLPIITNFELIAESAISLVTILMEFKNDAEAIYQSQTLLRSLIKKSEDFENHQLLSQLQELYESIQQASAR
ncbi:TPR-like protein [Rozella allomycis CSF55]|uniref:TPR-like protein n=1 Tax=Rozella allomycis (strain CSF55) TaxID=988480 RepID=A0A4V1IZD4_ROZAC|nr:TPR-like protein [Rozella allomycis CSF55]